MTTSKPEVRTDQDRLVKHTAYDEFQASEGIPIVTGFAVQDLRSVEVAPWARLECQGAYINLDGTGGTNDAYVAEIEPGKRMAPERHLFEKNIYVLDGRGATLVGDDPNSRTSFEWKRGSVFSVPINVWHQHMNRQRQRAGEVPRGDDRYASDELLPQRRTLSSTTRSCSRTAWLRSGSSRARGRCSPATPGG